MAKKSKKRRDTARSTPPVGAASTAAAPPTPSRPPKTFLIDWRWALALLALVLVAYLPVWRAGFTWDDDMFVSANPCIVGPLGLKEIWTTSAARFYPLVLTTFWFEHALWKLAPLPYHLVNLLLHATCAIVLWRILRRLAVPENGAWLGAALWALHPVQAETVAWISEMKNTESCLFYLLTIFFFVKGLNDENDRPGLDHALTFLCAALAMASKSSTLLLPIVLVLCVWWLKGRWQWRAMAQIGGIILMAIVAAILTSQTVKQNGTDEMQWSQTWQERLITGGDVFWFYLGKLLWPHPLITFYPRWQVDSGRWVAYLPLATVALVPIILWLKRQAWGRAWFFAFIYYLMNLLPVMGLFTMTGFRYSLVEDHLQYLASMGPLALAGVGLARIANFAPSGQRWLTPALGAMLLLVLGLLSWRQSWIYRDEHTLWTYNLAANPNSWLAYDGLGVEQDKAGRLDKAIEDYHRSIAINPNYAVTHVNLGTALAQSGQSEEAIGEFEASLAINPNSAVAHLKLGEALFSAGRTDDAIREEQRSLEIEPTSALAHNDLGLALVQKGQVDDAIGEYQKAVELDPKFPLVRNNLGVALFQRGEATQAAEEYQKALELDPNSAQTHKNLGLALAQSGILLLQQGQLDQAIAQFQEALTNDSTLVQAHSNLGIALAQQGKLDDARAQFQEALKLHPDDEAAQANLTRIKDMIGQRASSR